jgi:hypothetical protein
MKTFLAVLALSAGLSGSALATPIEWTIASGGNGHFYDHISTGPLGDRTVTGALVDAESQSYNGQAGYLITLTSAAEQAFYISQFGNVDGWIGAFDDDRDTDPTGGNEGVWKWMTGPEAGQQFWQGTAGGFATAPFFFASWASGQPDDFPNLLADAAVFNGGAWLDTTGSFANDFYLIEYDAGPTSAPVPEPASIFLVGSALVGLVVPKNRRRVRVALRYLVTRIR